ncbi:MAG: hypothetical protein DWQ37_20200, partial [Planctomycetota bacterium]
MEYSKRIASLELSRLGFHVDEIPEGSDKRADLCVKDDAHTYYIEAKEKFTADESPEQRQERYARGDYWRPVAQLAPNNTVSGVLRDAHGQLRQTPKPDSAFQLVWYHADSDLQWQLAFATFYGYMHLSATWPPEAESAECFYFTFSAAYAMPDVEALLLSEGDGLHMCMNEFSPRREEFRSSRLFNVFSLGQLDPVSMEASGEIIACRSSVSRKNPNDVVKSLRSYFKTWLESVVFRRRVKQGGLRMAELVSDELWEQIETLLPP